MADTLRQEKPDRGSDGTGRERDPIPAAETMVREQLIRRGIHDPGVLHWMARVPRERFVPEAARRRAYEDGALPLPQGQTISQPFMVAAMTQALGVEPGSRILEIGTGSGYQTALLALMGGQVHTVERHGALSREARERLEELGVKGVRYHLGDGTLGCPGEAPFHRILVTAGAPEIPPALLEQLGPGGCMVIPVGGREVQRLLRVTKGDPGSPETPAVQQEVLMECRFVPLTGAQGWPEEQE